WEAYKAKYEPTRKVRYFALPWVAAAVMALTGFTFLFLHDWTDSTEQPLSTIPMSAGETTDKPITAPEAERLASINVPAGKIKESTRNRVTLDKIDLPPLHVVHLTSKHMLTTKMDKTILLSVTEGSKPPVALPWNDDLIVGEQIDPNFAYQSEAAHYLSPKKLRLTDRFELGAFVSPSTTDRSFDLGGGLVFAYRFNDKIAIRTGASFNQYEVGMLKSDVQEIGEEKKQAAAAIKNTDKLISKEAASLRTNNFFIPNLSAVTGKVQTLDIPLDIRYNLTKEFYATGGVSYAAVLSQERFDHYEESAGIPTYSSASDSEKPVENPVTTIETTQISSDENINTNGFGGFVNFSVGRKVNMGKTIKVSIEPFVKFPVGQFKRADMNYTNGGIRIMTS